ncbi:hypothetical protein QBC47DRAFT_380763 [Echria macrotheca]|uniref:Uncharacterized protein n=1 Tax=Echria macrotheca TaxID=438768 RepID=A0AAJ0F9Q0_9PEZI|nr:hypothetical protein QBC47DRAFT_380763 [Echria macrotheca]
MSPPRNQHHANPHHAPHNSRVARPKPPPRSRLTETINKKTDEALEHAGVKINELREEQQRGMSEWFASELNKATDSTGKFMQDTQRETQREASKWLEHEMEKAPKVFMDSAKSTYLGWLYGEEGVMTAVLAWIPVALATGQTIKIGVDVAKLVYDAMSDPNTKRRRTLGY